MWHNEPCPGNHRPFTSACVKSPTASASAAAAAARTIWRAWSPRDAAVRRARDCRAPIWLTALPLRKPAIKRPSSSCAGPMLPSCRRTTTCCPRTSPWSAIRRVIKRAAREAGAIAQFAGGVPAMCDGVTQGQPGMELSLFSRDVIAMATGVALAHNMFDSALCLGICDKIVPGMLMGALAFGHLPVIFVPGGPMPSGVPNKEKARIRQLYAEGKAGRDELLESEAGSYHTAGTCTFYGTANSNQMLMEVMGLHMPGAAFVPPNTPLRDALTAAAAQRAARITALSDEYLPLASVIDEAAIVNGIVGLLATGGSTNHTLHLVAIARCAGISITWDDFSDLSAVVPLLTRIYPNGSADVNRFHVMGGMAFLIRELLGGGFLHGDTMTVVGRGLAGYAREPWLDDGRLAWRAAPAASGDLDVLRPVAEPFSSHGGLQLLTGNLGRADDQDFGNEARASRRRGAGVGVQRPGRSPRRIQGRQVVAGFRGGRALSRAARQRDAGAAQVDAVAGVAAEQGFPRGAGHRRPHVGRIRQRARRHSRHARSLERRRLGQGPRRRPDPFGLSRRSPRGESCRRDLAATGRARSRSCAQRVWLRPRIVCEPAARRRRRGIRRRVFDVTALARARP